MKRIAILMVLLFRASVVTSEVHYSESDFIGTWFYLDGNERVDVNHWVKIVKGDDGFNVLYNDGTKNYSGVMVLISDGRYLQGSLHNLGKVVVGKIRAVSDKLNMGIYLDLSGGPDDILLGEFQKKEVLEKILRKTLPAVN